MKEKKNFPKKRWRPKSREVLEDRSSGQNNFGEIFDTDVLPLLYLLFL